MGRKQDNPFPDNLPFISEVPDEGLGPAMLALSQPMRRFVIALLETGTDNYSRAALMAGYSQGRDGANARVMGSRLAHNTKVQAAIQEEARRRLGSMLVMATSVLGEIMQNKQNKANDRLKAAELVMNRAGLHAMTESKQTVELIAATDKEGIARIRQLAETMGMDPDKLLGAAGIVDAEFMELPPFPTSDTVAALPAPAAWADKDYGPGAAPPDENPPAEEVDEWISA